MMTQEGRNSSGSWRNTPEQMSLPRAKRFGSNRLDSSPEGDENHLSSRNDAGLHRGENMRKRSSSPTLQKKEGSTGSKGSESPRDYGKNIDESFLRSRNGIPYRSSNRHSSPVNLQNGRNINPEPYRSYSPQGRYGRKEIIEEPVKMTSAKSLEQTILREKSSISLENFRKKNDKGNMSPVGVVAPRRRTSDESRNKVDEAFWDDDESYKRRIPGYKEKMKQMEDVFNNEDSGQKIKMSAIEKKLRENTMKLSPQERFLDAKSKFLMMEKERLKEHDKNAQNLEKRRIIQDEAPISPEIIRNRPSWGKNDDSKVLKSQKAGLIRKNSFFELEPNEKESKG